jgi:hypothetical protein
MVHARAVSTAWAFIRIIRKKPYPVRVIWRGGGYADAYHFFDKINSIISKA